MSNAMEMSGTSFSVPSCGATRDAALQMSTAQMIATSEKRDVNERFLSSNSVILRSWRGARAVSSRHHHTRTGPAASDTPP